MSCCISGYAFLQYNLQKSVVYAHVKVNLAPPLPLVGKGRLPAIGFLLSKTNGPISCPHCLTNTLSLTLAFTVRMMMMLFI